MSYVPGFTNDIFISYAHADDSAWIEAFRDELGIKLNRLLGKPPVVIWKDTADLQRSQEYKPEIARNVSESAMLLALVSPCFAASEYCRKEECERFQAGLKERRAHFEGEGLRNQSFTLALSLIPRADGKEHELFPKISPVPFHEKGLLAPIGSDRYKKAFDAVLTELKDQLLFMRERCRPVFISPYRPEGGVKTLSERLQAELHKRYYRVLPADLSGLELELESSDCSSHLVGAELNNEQHDLIKQAKESGKPWVTCTTAAFKNTAKFIQKDRLDKLEAEGKLLLVSDASIWTDVRDALRINWKLDKPRVGVFVDGQADLECARKIIQTFGDRIEFTILNPAQRFAQVDAVLALAGVTSKIYEVAAWLIEFKDAERKPKWFGIWAPAESTRDVTAGLRDYPEVEVMDLTGIFEASAFEKLFSSLGAAAR